MAQGDTRVAAETASRQERQKQFDQSGNKFWLDDGQAAVFRFLEQGPDKFNFLRHPYKIQGKKGIQTRWFTCLNDKDDGTQCPGCTALEAKVRGAYCVIWRDRAVLRKGNDGKALRGNDGNFIVDGHQDQVGYWEVGSITAEAIRQLDAEAGGLMSRDFKVSRTSGTQFQPYVINPADMNTGAVAMSEADMQLAASKPNLDEAYAPPTYAEAAKIVASQAQFGNQQQAPAQQQAQPQAPAQPVNPFAPEQPAPTPQG